MQTTSEKKYVNAFAVCVSCLDIMHKNITIIHSDEIKQLKKEQEQLMGQVSRKEQETEELQRQLKEFKNQISSNLQILSDKE